MYAFISSVFRYARCNACENRTLVLGLKRRGRWAGLQPELGVRNTFNYGLRWIPAHNRASLRRLDDAFVTATVADWTWSARHAGVQPRSVNHASFRHRGLHKPNERDASQANANPCPVRYQQRCDESMNRAANDHQLHDDFGSCCSSPISS